MRPEPNIRAETYRNQNVPQFRSPPGANWGAFRVRNMNVISSGVDDEHGWEHVSVSCENRTPSWSEMQEIKEMFWSDDETVIQFHPRKDKYINHHPFVLHLWRKIGVDHELPPPKTIA